MSDFFVSILSGEIKWTALNQSMLNGVLLLVAIWFIRREARSVYSRIDQSLEMGREALREIKGLKMSDLGHEKDIDHLKQDVDTLFGRPKRRKS